MACVLARAAVVARARTAEAVRVLCSQSLKKPHARQPVPSMVLALLLSALIVNLAPAAALSPIHEALRSRRTVHNFDNARAVPDDVLHRAVEAATYAPNHKMTEPWLFRRLGPDAIQKIAELNAASIADPEKAAKKAKRWVDIRNWLVVTSRVTPGDELLTLEDYAATCCAVQNLQLSFADEDVGTKWTSGDIQRTPEFERICGLDAASERVAGVIWYGYAADGVAPAAPKRKLGVEEVLLSLP